MYPAVRSHSIHFPDFATFFLTYFDTTVRISEFTELLLEDLALNDLGLRPMVTPGLSGVQRDAVSISDSTPVFLTHPLHSAHPRTGADLH